jgi:hypothetical protein
MWPVSVVVRGVLVEHGGEVPFAGDEDTVEALAADGADPTFGVGVRAGRLWRRLDDVDAGRGEHRVEDSGEFRVAVAQQEPQIVGSLVEIHKQIAGLLGDPGAARVGGNAGDVHLPGGDLDEEQYVDPFEEDVSTVKRSQARMPRAWAVRNCFQVGPVRRGAGSTPAR